ncbi:DUF397 domain-containing protein [Streptosporangium sp. NBC_01810]|uniref:DUF397 domain-containing protein n=1 Tax=Streptosporangium sp. NBC_01810 TaxID=2975951 RepID=UPI002DD9CC78|nr:DUF397 domain-containing protein [Streptosporangium sp. NBC_01810]WSA23609.1 DUF397 domain-containing protein [Streptosporangium sp. NBC_01810]
MNKELDLSRVEWRTSSLSGSNGQCVQVAFLGEYVAVRDSKHPQGPTLIFRPSQWSVFISGLKSGETVQNA